MKRQRNYQMSLMRAVTMCMTVAFALLAYVATSQQAYVSIDQKYHSDWTGDNTNDKVYAYLPVDHLEEGEPISRNASFPGGERAYSDYMLENFVYPNDACENGMEGVLMAQFLVNTDGSISHVSIKESVSPTVDAEAIRVIQAMPQWNPALLNGQPLRTKVILPISVKLL